MTSQETKPHPELTIVSRILQHASIPLTQTQFDQQWTPTQLRTAFQWTRHLSNLFLSLDEDLSSLSSGQLVMTPQRIVKSFVKSREIISRQSLSNSNGKYNDYRSSSSTTLSAPLEQPTAGTSPTEAELLDPLVALQRRLLSNPGLTDMARLDILSLTCSQPQQDGSLIEINSSALVKQTARQNDAATLII
jgi:hypothetical protein